MYIAIQCEDSKLFYNREKKKNLSGTIQHISNKFFRSTIQQFNRFRHLILFIILLLLICQFATYITQLTQTLSSYQTFNNKNFQTLLTRTEQNCFNIEIFSNHHEMLIETSIDKLEFTGNYLSDVTLTMYNTEEIMLSSTHQTFAPTNKIIQYSEADETHTAAHQPTITTSINHNKQYTLHDAVSKFVTIIAILLSSVFFRFSATHLTQIVSLLTFFNVFTPVTAYGKTMQEMCMRCCD